MSDEISGTGGQKNRQKKSWERQGEELDAAALHIAKWQRHVLLREYGDDGHVLPENLELSRHISSVLGALGYDGPALATLARLSTDTATESDAEVSSRGGSGDA